MEIQEIQNNLENQSWKNHTFQFQDLLQIHTNQDSVVLE